MVRGSRPGPVYVVRSVSGPLWGCLVDGEAAEAAGIDEADFAAVGEGKDGMGMRRQRDFGRGDEQAAGHAEVDEEFGRRSPSYRGARS